MKFNADGYLAAGLHPTTLTDMKTHLVDAFTSSAKRPRVFAGYSRHTADLQQFPVPVNQFVGGSFVSSKEEPSDIDLLGMADQAKIDQMDPAKQAAFMQMFLGDGSKPAYECDAYFLASFPDTDPAYPHYRVMRKYWMGEFGFDRLDKPKGILTLTVAPSPEPPTPAATS